MSAGGFRLPPISGVPALSTIARAAVLDSLFEPCAALHTLSLELLHTETFESYNDLIASVGVQLTDLSESPSTSDTEWLDKILGAHPRLGEKKVESAQSRAEQAQLNTGDEEEAIKLRDLNAEYEKTFPSLKYVYEPCKFVELGLISSQGVCQWKVEASHHGEHAFEDRQRGHQT